MNKLMELLQQSVLVQALITLSLVLTSCYLAILGRPVPDTITTALSLVLGFYFGSKIQQRINSHSPTKNEP